MGNDHSSSRTNLGKTCTSFQGNATGIEACWGDSLVVFTRIGKEDDHRDVWGADYNIGKQGHMCHLELRARQDDNGVESINFGLGDYAGNSTDFSVDITRVGRDGLRGGITGLKCSGRCWSYTFAKQNYSVETTVVSYNCPDRDGFFVLQKKKMNNSENAYKVVLSHRYVTKDFGLSVWAEIYRRKGKGFVVEVNGPHKYSSAQMRRYIDEARRTGECPSVGKFNAKTEDSNSSSKSNNTAAQIVKCASNHGTADSFNNQGNGNQNFSNATIYQRYSYNIYSK